MFVAILLIIQMCTSLLCWRLNLALPVSQGSASTCFRWSGHFRHSFVKGLFWNIPSNFYWNRFIFDRQGAKNKLAQFFETRCRYSKALLRLLSSNRSVVVEIDEVAAFRMLYDIFVSLGIMSTLLYIMTTAIRSGFLLTPIRMTLNDLEWPIHVKDTKTSHLERWVWLYNVRKLHRPHMSDAFLADTVDTTRV